MLKKNDINSFLSKISSKNIVLYGYGTIGKILEKYILEHKKDIKIIAVIDNSNQFENTLQKGIKTISFDSFLKSKKFERTDYEVVICNDMTKIVDEIRNTLNAFDIYFLPHIISRYDLEYTIPREVRFLSAIFLPILMLKETSTSIYNIISSLIKYDLKYLSGNTKRLAFNQLYYYTQSYNLEKFGRYGISKLIGGGDYDLKKFFYINPISLKFQATFGTTFTMFFAMCFWIISWIVLYSENTQLPALLTFCIFSTLFFAVFIEQQNYNILGWMLYPIFLTLLLVKSYIAISIVLFFISLFSFTAFFVAGVLIFIDLVYTFDYLLIFTIIPATIRTTIPIVISFIKTDGLKNIAAGIGMHEKVKYSRVSYKKLDIKKGYILSIVTQFSVFYIFASGFNELSLLLLSINALFILNELASRFADQQSFYISYMSISLFVMLNVEANLALTISFLVSIYPVYGYLINVRVASNSFLTPGIKTPFSAKKTIQELGKLYKDIPENSKLFVAYRNPKGEYSNIFNGYRWFNEPLQYVATINNISLFPDWYMVFDNNTQSSREDFWIDNNDNLLTFVKNEDIKYVIVPHFLYNDELLDSFELIGRYNLDFDVPAGKRTYIANLLKLKDQ